MDWVDLVWPEHLRAEQRESTNKLSGMMYPKVQKYAALTMRLYGGKEPCMFPWLVRAHHSLLLHNGWDLMRCCECMYYPTVNIEMTTCTCFVRDP